MPLLNLFYQHQVAPHRFKVPSTTILLVFICLMPGYTWAQTPIPPANNKALKDVRDKITATSARAEKYEAEANSLGQEIDILSRDLVTAAQEIQTTEGDVYDKEDLLVNLDHQKRSLQDTLKTRYGQMAKTLAAMQRLSQQPGELVAYRPDTALNSLRSASLLKTLQPELKRRAETIQKDMTELQVVRVEINQEREELRNLLAALTSEQIEMNQLLAERRAKQKKLRLATQEERKKLKQFAAQAQSLQDLIARIEQETRARLKREKREREKAAQAAAKRLGDKPQNITSNIKSNSATANLKPGQKRGFPAQGGISFRKAKGTMPLPARGSIRLTFGTKTPEGLSSEGITIHTLPQATVVSPHEGRIVFAGKFRSYGLLLIIAHGQEYHTLLAGMTRLDAEVGQWVLKGEPIGQMAPNLQLADASGAVVGQNLYVELRRMGKPINPLPWIAARDRKVL